MHDPTPSEIQLMDDWISDLRAFIHHDKSHKYGTAGRDEFKVMTSKGSIEVQRDSRWSELLQVMNLFSG